MTDEDDLTIPDFLRATGPGTPCKLRQREVETSERQHGYGPSCWEERNRPQHLEASELAAALKQYKDEKRFAVFQQWCLENPELAAMNRKAKRDAERRIAKLGIPPAKRPRRA